MPAAKSENIKPDTLRSALVGAIALLLLALIKPLELWDFLLWAITGTFLSTFFLVPIDRAIITGELRVREVTCFVAGAAIFVWMFLFVYESVLEGVVFVLEWLVIYNLVSLFFALLEALLP